MTFTSGETLSSWGSAVSPSITGISISSTMTSVSARPSAEMAIWPLPTEATTAISGSASSVRVSSPRITAESSTTMTRMGFATVPPGAVVCAAASTMTVLFRALR